MAEVLKMTFPAPALSVRTCPPLIVPLRFIFAPVELRVNAWPRIVLELSVIWSAVVEMLPDKLILPVVAARVTAPSEISPPVPTLRFP
jgi:hypothetical protein